MNAEAVTEYRPRHIAALDGVRGLAVLIVFLFHYGGGTHSSFTPMKWFGYVNKGGWSGVVLFFVLSGFLITGILWDSFDDPQWWRKFFARRSLRIFPLYYLSLALVLIAAALVHTASAAWHVMWVPALFLENSPALGGLADTLPSPLGIFHLWSIAVEEQFYLVWPWLLWLFARQRTEGARREAMWMCRIIFLLSLILRFYIWRHMLWAHMASPDAWAHALPVQAGALAAGGWLALAYRGPEWERVVRMAPAAFAFGTVGFLIAGMRSHNFETTGAHMMTWGLPLVTVGFAGMVALTLTNGLTARCFRMGWLRWLGNISYGVYVFHMLLLRPISAITDRVARGRGPMVHNAAMFLIAALMSLGAAWLSYHAFEKQFLRLKKYFVPRV